MKIKVIGTSAAIGIPAPVCDCEYCNEIVRYRPSIYVEGNKRSFLFDVSPDVRQQLAGIKHQKYIGNIFLTHHHSDHANGLHEINHHIEKKSTHIFNSEEVPDKNDDWFDVNYDMYCTDTTFKYLRESMPHVVEHESFRQENVKSGEELQKDGLTITPFATNHCDGMVGYSIENESSQLVYLPDYGEVEDDLSIVENPDVLFIDGSSFLGYDIHGTEKRFRKTLDRISPDKTFLLNVSEHIAQVDTDTLKRRAREYNCRIPDYGQLINL